jgi:pimeloyl-ACP methyl ester carboxylesterase
MSSRQLALPDGRTLDIYVSGPDEGLPLVFHMGTPGAAVPVRHLERAAHARGLRFVTSSRPGYGGSTRQPGRAVADVVDDTASLLAALEADRCVVAGWSGGGPHALACVARLDAVAASLVIAGVAPYGEPDLDFLAGMGQDNVDEFGAALRGEPDVRAFLEAIRPDLVQIRAEQVAAGFGTDLLPEVGLAVLTDEFAEDLAAAFREAVRASVDGWVDDDLAFTRPWGFDLGEITKPTAVWQGSEDRMVPFAHGEWFAKHLPQATVHLEQGEGQLSVGLGAIDRMLDELARSPGVRVCRA